MDKEPALVKISGDLIARKDVLKWIRDLSKIFSVVIYIGGGTKISKILDDLNIPYEFTPFGRIIKSVEKRLIAKKILEEHKAKVKKILAKHDIIAEVEIPVDYIGAHLNHMNGDTFVLKALLTFENNFILTFEGTRAENKKDIFGPLYPRVQIISFPINAT